MDIAGGCFGGETGLVSADMLLKDALGTVDLLSVFVGKNLKGFLAVSVYLGLFWSYWEYLFFLFRLDLIWVGFQNKK